MLPLPKRLKMSRWNLQPWQWLVWESSDGLSLVSLVMLLQVWIYPFQLSRNIIHICQHICSDIRCSQHVELFGKPQIMVTDNRFIKLQNMAVKSNELKHKCRVVVFRYNHKIAVVVVHHWMPRNVDVKLLTTEPSNCGRHRLSGPALQTCKKTWVLSRFPKKSWFLPQAKPGYVNTFPICFHLTLLNM